MALGRRVGRTSGGARGEGARSTGLPVVHEDMERKRSELEEKDSELQSARQVTEDAKAECDSERAAFQEEKDGLLRELK